MATVRDELVEILIELYSNGTLFDDFGEEGGRTGWLLRNTAGKPAAPRTRAPTVAVPAFL